MNRVLRLQISIFGSFENIGNDDTIKEEAPHLISVFGGKFLPNVMQLFSLEYPESRYKKIDRLSMFSSEKKITIIFLPERIDCNYEGPSDDVVPQKIDVQLQTMSHILQKGLNHFSVIGNRLAANGQYSTSHISTDITEYFKPRSFYRDGDIAEWSVDCNRVVPIQIGNSHEETNNILNLNMRSDAQDDKMALVTFDINTRPENTRMRFDGNALPDFIDQIIRNLNAMLDGLR